MRFTAEILDSERQKKNEAGNFSLPSPQRTKQRFGRKIAGPDSTCRDIDDQQKSGLDYGS